MAPIEINLGENKIGDTMTMHYVPIAESIAALYDNNKDYISLLRSVNKDETLNDICDGLSHKNNELLSDQEAFDIILYQDSFEIVNPLESAKRKHKLLGVYYTLGNQKPERRSQIDHIQVVLLCKESAFQMCGVGSQKVEKVFAKLIHDLKTIEVGGVTIDGNKKVRGKIICIACDNLGSNLPRTFPSLTTFSDFVRFHAKTFIKLHVCPGPLVQYQTIS